MDSGLALTERPRVYTTVYGTSRFLLPPIPWGLFKKNSRLPRALSAYWSIDTMIAWTW